MRGLLGFVVRKPLISVAFVGIVCGLAYANSLNNNFQYDDRHSIVHNEHLRKVDFTGFFAHPEWFSRDPEKAMFRPLLVSTLALNYAWGEYDPVSYHVVNIIIHAGCAILLTLLLRQLSIPPCMALLGGLTFALHPVCTEPVNYISSRSELLATLGVLSSFLLYDSARNASKRAQAICLTASSLCFAGGLLSKSIAIVLPALLVLRELLLVSANREGWQSRAVRLLPHFAIAAVYVVFMERFIQTALFTDPVRSLSSQIGTQLKALPFYVKLLALPSGLNVSHPFRAEEDVYWPLALAVLVSLPLLAFFARSWRGEWKVTFFGIGWMAIAAAPTFFVPLNVLVNEHRLYLPLAGVVIALMGIPRFESLRGLLPGATVLLGLFLILVLQRNPIWADEWTLWSDAASKAPGNAQPLVYMGNYAREHGDLETAAALLEKALTGSGDHFVARANLANTYRLMGRLKIAHRMYAELAAEYAESSDIRYNLARTFHDMGDFARARSNYLLVSSDSRHVHLALNNLGVLHQLEAQLDSAVYYYGRALARGPTEFLDARDNLNRIGSSLVPIANELTGLGDHVGLASLCRQLLAIDTHHRDALLYLASALLHQGKLAESLRVNDKLIQFHPDFGHGYLQLGYTLEVDGQLKAAGNAYRKLSEMSLPEPLAREGARRLQELEVETR